MSFDSKTLAENIRKLRLSKSAHLGRTVTQAEVAEAVGVSAATMQNYELGRSIMGYETAWMIADYYGVSLDELGGRSVAAAG